MREHFSLFQSLFWFMSHRFRYLTLRLACSTLEQLIVCSRARDSMPYFILKYKSALLLSYCALQENEKYVLIFLSSAYINKLSVSPLPTIDLLVQQHYIVIVDAVLSIASVSSVSQNKNHDDDDIDLSEEKCSTSFDFHHKRRRWWQNKET